MSRDAADEAGLRFLARYEPAMPPSEELKIEVTLAPRASRSLYAALRVGVRRLYVVSDMGRFLSCVRCGRRLRFGKGFAYDPSDHGIAPEDRDLLEYLWDIVPEADGDARWLEIPRARLSSFLDRLGGRPFRLKGAQEERMVIADRVPDIEVRLMPGRTPCRFPDHGLRLIISAPEGYAALSDDHAYCLSAGCIRRIPEAQREALLPLLDALDGRDTVTLSFGGHLASRLVGEALPDIRRVSRLIVDDELRHRIIEGSLSVRFWIDARDGDVLLRVLFDYGSGSVDPFGGESMLPPSALLMRDRRRESEVHEALERFAFRVRRGVACLHDPEDILRFCAEGTDALTALGEVFISEAFLRVRPRRVRIKGRMKTSGHRIRLQLDLPDEDDAALPYVLEGLRASASWVRLPDGAFLELPEPWIEVAADLPPPDADGAWTLTRAAALSAGAFWNPDELAITLSEQADRLYRGLQQPEIPVIAQDALLRPYQREGVAWLWARYRVGLGGILADDMGLGKTLQTLALLEHAKARDGFAPSLVIAPTSLLYNWREECLRFTPGLRVVVLEGGPEARREQLTAGDVDLFVVSYAQLRRDEELFNGVAFRCLILDEAQQVKNAATQGARAVRGIDACTRFALTGTPLENHAGELWAIMDVVLAGYLGPLPDFSRRLEVPGGEVWLRRRIAPFLLRRMKRDVLADLPERIDHRVSVAMTEQQEALYRSTSASLRRSLSAAVGRDGTAKHRMRILAALTKLRQIADHPAMIAPGYTGGSGKMEALMDLLSASLDGGHRILVFSQFTAMLGLVREALGALGLAYLYLDGATPMKQREQLIRWYHQGVADVFLISLKAGGIGLNLARADTVILLDPWWNPAAEQQAGDRAHRIGQAHAVHVIRLITKDSVEEAVSRMQEQKRALTESLLSPDSHADWSPSDWLEILSGDDRTGKEDAHG